MKQPLRYPTSVIVLHWLAALALTGNFVIGWLLDDHEELLALHRSIGIAILILVLIRLSNRLRMRNQLPPSLNAAAPSAHFVEVAAHYSLYVLMFAVPVLGWLKTNAAGHAVNCFGLFSLPALVPQNHVLSHWLGQLHALCAYGLATLVTLHVLAALAHRLFRGRDVFQRIIPARLRAMPGKPFLPD